MAVTATATAHVYMRDSTSTAATGKLRAGEEYDVPLDVALRLIELGIAGREVGPVVPLPPGAFVASNRPALGMTYAPVPYIPPRPAPPLGTLTRIRWPKPAPPPAQPAPPPAEPAPSAPQRHARMADDVRYSNAWEPFADVAGEEWSIEGYLTRTGVLSSRKEGAL